MLARRTVHQVGVSGAKQHPSHSPHTLSRRAISRAAISDMSLALEYCHMSESRANSPLQAERFEHTSDGYLKRSSGGQR